MGLNKFTRTPCGFCFVEFYFHKDCMNAKHYLNGTKLDDRIIRVDIDPGFEEGRQYGRGKSGGQVREDRRDNYDEERGGWAGSMAGEKAADRYARIGETITTRNG